MSGHIFTETAQAIVTNTNDPDRLGRIKVRCGAVTGNDIEIPVWVAPEFPFAGEGHGWFILPEVGDAVLIEYTTGSTLDRSYAQTFLTNPNFRYRSAFYKDRNDLPSEMRDGNYRKRYGIKMKSGAILLFDISKNEVALDATLVRLGTIDAGEKAVVGESYQTWMESTIDEVESLRAQVKAIRDVAELHIQAWEIVLSANGAAMNAIGVAFAASGLDPLIAAAPVATTAGTVNLGIDMSGALGTLATVDTVLTSIQNNLASQKSVIDDHLSTVVKIAKS